MDLLLSGRAAVRRQTRQVRVGNVLIGADAPVVVQSMTNTDTVDALKTAIQCAEPNDFARLAAELPRLRRVCFNGKTSAKFERWFGDQSYVTCVLPSTSPAYTLTFERKLELWRQALSSKAVSC